MTSHGNPTLLLPGGATAGQVVVVSDGAGRAVWRSHALAAGRTAVCVDVRDGRFGGPGRGWSVLPPGHYRAPGAGGAVEVVAQRSIEARFDAPPADWMPPGTAWHRDGAWRASDGEAGGIAPAAAGGRDRGGADRGAADSPSECSYLFVDAAMHATVTACFTAPAAPAPQRWGLIARHYNDAHHLRLELCSRRGHLAVRLLRRAADADPEHGRRTLAQARAAPESAGPRELRWHFNGTRHEVLLDGAVLLGAEDGFMGGVEIVGLFAEAGAAAAAWHSFSGAESAADARHSFSGVESSGATWHSFSVVSSQWVPRHVVRRGAYAAVVRPGNVHQLHLCADPGQRPARLDPRSNVFWESGLQVGHIGGSEIKFTQGAALDLLARGAVADLVRWRGPMPRFVDQDADVRGYARGHAVCYDDRLVVADWAAVRVRRSVGPDFDLLGRAMSGPARIAAAGESAFTVWELPANGLTATLSAGACARLYPAALVFPLRVAGAAWHLVAALGGLNHVGGEAPGRVLGWRCPRGLTASHGLRVAPTVPGVEYGFWIAVTWLATADTGAAEAAALLLRDQFQVPARLTAYRGALLGADAAREQPADRAALAGGFDRAIGAYRLQAAAGQSRFTFDPGPVARAHPAFLISGPGRRRDEDAGVAGDTCAAAAAAGRTEAVVCIVDGARLTAGPDFRWQWWPAPAGVLVQLRRTVTAPVTVEIGLGC
ncbi:MAG: hypothetical protein OXP69_18210 [Spirochaetaceae bacterium]|nr:hypothetical protein [Spirochaetaceae bacterium]